MAGLNCNFDARCQNCIVNIYLRFRPSLQPTVQTTAMKDTQSDVASSHNLCIHINLEQICIVCADIQYICELRVWGYALRAGQRLKAMRHETNMVLHAPPLGPIPFLCDGHAAASYPSAAMCPLIPYRTSLVVKPQWRYRA